MTARVQALSYPRLFAAWCAILVFMIANGMLRELVLRPRIGPSTADIASALLGAVIVLAGTAFFFRRLAGHATVELLRVSGFLVTLTVAFEFLFGHYVDGKTWGELAANYQFWNGRLWPFLLLLLALTPFIWGRWALGGRRAR